MRAIVILSRIVRRRNSTYVMMFCCSYLTVVFLALNAEGGEFGDRRPHLFHQGSGEEIDHSVEGAAPTSIVPNVEAPADSEASNLPPIQPEIREIILSYDPTRYRVNRYSAPAYVGFIPTVPPIARQVYRRYHLDGDWTAAPY